MIYIIVWSASLYDLRIVWSTLLYDLHHCMFFIIVWSTYYVILLYIAGSNILRIINRISILLIINRSYTLIKKKKKIIFFIFIYAVNTDKDYSILIFFSFFVCFCECISFDPSFFCSSFCCSSFLLFFCCCWWYHWTSNFFEK